MPDEPSIFRKIPSIAEELPLISRLFGVFLSRLESLLELSPFLYLAGFSDETTNRLCTVARACLVVVRDRVVSHPYTDVHLTKVQQLVAEFDAYEQSLRQLAGWRALRSSELDMVVRRLGMLFWSMVGMIDELSLACGCSVSELDKIKKHRSFYENLVDTLPFALAEKKKEEKGER